MGKYVLSVLVCDFVYLKVLFWCICMMYVVWCMFVMPTWLPCKQISLRGQINVLTYYYYSWYLHSGGPSVELFAHDFSLDLLEIKGH